MKILPITNNNIQNKNIAHKGYVGENTTKSITTMSDDIAKFANTTYANNPDLKNIALNLSERVSNILKNMQTLMLNFGKTCKLDYIENKKNESSTKNVLFVITSDDSDYAQTVESVELRDTMCPENIEALERFVAKCLLELNPDETNVKFKIMKKPGIYDHRGDNFAPEERIWYPKDSMVLPLDSLLNLTERRMVIDAADLDKNGAV